MSREARKRISATIDTISDMAAGDTILSGEIVARPTTVVLSPRAFADVPASEESMTVSLTLLETLVMKAEDSVSRPVAPPADGGIVAIPQLRNPDRRS